LLRFQPANRLLFSSRFHRWDASTAKGDVRYPRADIKNSSQEVSKFPQEVSKFPDTAPDGVAPKIVTFIISPRCAHRASVLLRCRRARYFAIAPLQRSWIYSHSLSLSSYKMHQGLLTAGDRSSCYQERWLAASVHSAAVLRDRGGEKGMETPTDDGLSAAKVTTRWTPGIAPHIRRLT